MSRTKYCDPSGSNCTILDSGYDIYSRRTDTTVLFTGSAGNNIFGSRYQHFDFDSMDRLVRSVDSVDAIPGSPSDDIVTEYAVDTLGRIRSEEFGNDGTGNPLWSVVSGYNTTGQRNRLTYPAHGSWPEKRLLYDWDPYGRLSALVDLQADGVTPNETIVSYGYSAGSRLVQAIHADGSVWQAPTASAWDGAARRKQAQVRDSATTPSILFEEKLFFDKNDRVTRIEWPQGRAAAGETEAQVFGYDELDRLTGFQQGRWQGASFFNAVRTSAHDWTLDELGNWRQHTDRSRSAAGPTVSLGVDPVNAYTQWLSDDNGDGTIQSAESVALAYDEARGFLVRQPTADGKGWKYWHDGFGRLSKVERCSDTACSGAPESTVEYRYTADGRLAWRDRTSDAAAAVWLLYDGGQVIAEQSASERVSWSVWSGGSVVQWRGKLAPNGSVDTLQLHQDRIGSVVLGTRWNSTEQKTEVWTQRQYDPYGRHVVSIGWERNDPELPYGFAGQRLDAETGLYLMGARWYSAELGRFIEQDPIAEGGGLNLYAYVGSSPTLWVDPSGLKPDSWWIVRGPDGRSDREKQAARHVEEREARLGAEAAGRFSDEVARQERHLAQMMQTAADERENRAVSAILDAFIASSRTSDEPATVEVGKGAVIAVALPSQGQAAAQLALARGGDIAVLAPGILNSAEDILTNSVHLANDKGLTVIALMNESKGYMLTGAGGHGGGTAGLKTAAAIDLLEATASEFGVPTSNSVLAESVLTPLNAALEGQNDLHATVIGHSRGAIDVENAALSAGGYPNLDLITIGGAASPTREHWKSRRAVVAYDPVPYAALLRSALLGRGDTLPVLVPEVGHSFASYYEHIFASTPPTPRFQFDSVPGMLNRAYLRQ